MRCLSEGLFVDFASPAANVQSRVSDGVPAALTDDASYSSVGALIIRIGFWGLLNITVV